jgi:hypothetical protein
MDIRDIRRAALAERELVSIEVLKFLSHRSLVRAKDITQHIVTLSIVTLPNEMTERELYWFCSGVFAYVYYGLRLKQLIASEGRYKECPKNTQFRITDDGRKFLSEYENGSDPRLLSWTPSAKS